MKCAALTGISPEVIKDLKKGNPRTIELQSTHNIVSIATVTPGPETHVFMTSVDHEDLRPGGCGNMCLCACHINLDEKDGGVFAWLVFRGTGADICEGTGKILCNFSSQAGLPRR